MLSCKNIHIIYFIEKFDNKQVKNFILNLLFQEITADDVAK